MKICSNGELREIISEIPSHIPLIRNTDFSFVWSIGDQEKFVSFLVATCVK